jgi:hypothetical protein
MSRRLRSPGVQKLLAATEAALNEPVSTWWVQRIDSKPLPIGAHSKDPDARWGKCGQSFSKGYRLHAVCGAGPLPRKWRVEPMNTGDARAARSLVKQYPGGGGYLVGDKQYDSNPLHAAATAAGYQLVAPQKRPGKALGHGRHEPGRLRSLELVQRPFGKALLEYRRDIERFFGTLTSSSAGLAPLPAWVRTLHRVQLWVQAKLIINALRQRSRTRSLDPSLAVA